MKKKMFVLAALAIILATLAGGTLAYFTVSETAHNVITTGGVDIELVEKTLDENGKEVPFPKNGLTGIMPNTTASKIVWVENTSGSEAWIRAKLDFEIIGADGKELPLTDEEGHDMIGYTTEGGWRMKDGWVYYSKPVAPDGKTLRLMEEVVFNPIMDNRYQNCTVHIDITAQAVQTANNGETVLEAQGWPES